MPDLWFILPSPDLRSLLDRAAAGEDPDLLIAETYANAVSERVDGPTNPERRS